MIAVFDLDDTISVHKNRDYPNAIPIMPVIEKIRELSDAGWEIVIYTARGQVSCNGDVKLIEERNRPVIEEWLKKNNVPCDKLIFGKPLGDLYVDDKGISLNDFLNQPIKVLKGGGSGKNVYRIGNTVKKEFGSIEETEAFKRWNEHNETFHVFNTPKIHSYLYNAVYMEYIEGVHATSFYEVIRACEACKKFKEPFDVNIHIQRMQSNLSDNEEYNNILYDIISFLKKNEKRLEAEGSFCHGDMILSNIIVREGKPYYLDARYTEGANSYLLDLAKMRMSYSGYEYLFGISDVEYYETAIAGLDRYCNMMNIFDLVCALEIMFIIRCYRYKNEADKKKIIDFTIREYKKWKRG